MKGAKGCAESGKNLAGGAGAARDDQDDVLLVDAARLLPQLNLAVVCDEQHGLKNIPVLDHGSKPVGVLNARDVVQALLEDVQYEERLLRDYVSCVGYR